MTLANKFSLLRILLTPIFVIIIFLYSKERDWLRYMALAVFAMAMVSDALDGFLARAKKESTPLGSFLDPMADKLLLNASFIFLSVKKGLPFLIPGVVTIVVISRDIILILGFWMVHLFTGALDIKPTVLGKVTTIFQMFTVVVVLLDIPFASLWCWLTLVVTIASAIDYIYRGSRLLNSGPQKASPGT